MKLEVGQLVKIHHGKNHASKYLTHIFGKNGKIMKKSAYEPSYFVSVEEKNIKLWLYSDEIAPVLKAAKVI